MSDPLLPIDEGDIAAAVGEAARAREPLAIVGNATKAGMLRPVQAARSISTRNLTGITLYSPNELIISARAGTPLADIEATLAEHGQHIIAEPLDLAAITGAREQQTLGGVIATNLSGPRRVAWGAMRDHVL
ncbi:MAG TPA: FAD-binding protein, partial [Acetobacteraceae bacterium]